MTTQAGNPRIRNGKQVQFWKVDCLRYSIIFQGSHANHSTTNFALNFT